MNILLENDDLSRLSKAALVEIFGLIANKGGAQNSTPESSSKKPQFELLESDVDEFMSSVSDRTKNFLRVFTEHKGVGKVDDLLIAADCVDIKGLGSLIAATTKRVRKLDRSVNSKAVLIVWDWNEESEHWDGDYRITPKSTQSLISYFKTSNRVDTP